jgi:hypothetical protein
LSGKVEPVGLIASLKSRVILSASKPKPGKDLI